MVQNIGHRTLLARIFPKLTNILHPVFHILPMFGTSNT